MHPNNVKDLSLVNACVRPSGESYRDKLTKHEINYNADERVADLLSDSYGFLCIEENQLVDTKRGLVPIKEVTKGDYVVTRNGWNKVLDAKKTGVKNTIKIFYNGTSIQTTPEHRLLTDCGWKEAKDIVIGDVIAYRVNYDTENIKQNKLSRILGWLIGDGDMSKNNTVSFVNRDYNVTKAFKDEVENLYPDIEVVIFSRPSRVNKIPLWYAYIRYKKQVKKEKQIILDISKVGLLGKIATNKFVPEYLFCCNNEEIKEFLGAYTDTDSCLKNKNRKVVVYKTASKDLAIGLQTLIRKIGYSSYISEAKGAYSIIVKDCIQYLKELYDYSIKIRKFYQKEELVQMRYNSGNAISLKTVKDILPKQLWKTSQKNGFSVYGKSKYKSIDGFRHILNKYNIDAPDYLLNENIKWVKVQHIIQGGDTNVYDLTVENEHEFVCQGIIVHNCYQEQQIKFMQQICGLTGSQADTVRRAIGEYLPPILEII